MPNQTAIKVLDRKKYPPNETSEQVALRVARDQLEFGVAEGEPDMRYLLNHQAP